MPTTDAETKVQRLLELQMLFWRAPGRGLRTAEIATYLGVTERTARNYLEELSVSGRLPIYKEGWEWRLVEGARMELLPVRLDLEEGALLYLAARLLARHSDEPTPAIRAALVKLIAAMPGTLSAYLERLVQDLPTQADPQYEAVFHTIVYGWATRRVVDLTYHPLRLDPYRARFCPYLLEPSAVGYTVYALGRSDPPGALRTYKLERITRAELTDASFELPAGFDGMGLLRQAWGVMYGQQQTVRLRFARGTAARRVTETIWHPSQAYHALDDGSVEWSAEVGDWLEMLPWVRGWGGDVEVIEPEELRQAMIDESRRLAALYKVAEIEPPPLYQRLWAKADRKTGKMHPLICHLIDVAEVALALWNDVLTDGMRGQFADALGLDIDSAGRVVAFWAGLHDLGKASPCFQRKHGPSETVLTEAGLLFPRLFTQVPCPHGTISADTLAQLLETETGLGRREAARVARAVGGHHGEWPVPKMMEDLTAAQKGDQDWQALRRELFAALAEHYVPPPVEGLGDTTSQANAVLTLLSGLTSTADWLGSMELFFPYTTSPVNVAAYAERAAARARQALGKLGWIGWRPPTKAALFEELFTFSPRPMQSVVIDVARQMEQPSLVIIEAPTGSGKTEAALYLADHWARTCQQRGLYVAMPTMATSNQMFARVQEVLRRRYPNDLVNIHLIHGQARWRADMQDIQLETFDDRESGTVAAMAWFLPHKRSLLAPFGVGTVDQALLSVLLARHFFVRLFGLCHKTVVFDEVHAYDSYMSTIFQRLLSWLRAVGASVVILSATLPAETRRALVEAYAGEPAPALPDAPYPALTWASDHTVRTVPLPAPDGRTIDLSWIDRDPQAIVTCLADGLCEGGCAALICNTVGRAQAVYQALRDAAILAEDEIVLFHARFPFAWRDEIEHRVLESFGRDGVRPPRAIVVATQVIEQSLDLDFDLMISDLAPVDLVLQRAGRLHRHERRGRPDPVSRPRMVLTRPVEQEGVPDFESDAWVYEPYVLLRSYVTVQDRTSIVLPAETQPLIEAVYGPEDSALIRDRPPSFVAALERARARMEKNREKEQHEARTRLIAMPDNRRLMTIGGMLLEEDHPELHASLRALTRLIPPSVSLVCLHQTDAGLTLEPGGSEEGIDLSLRPASDQTEQLVRHTVTVSHRSVVEYFLNRDVPEGWRDHALLRDHREAVFVDGACRLDGAPYTLVLSRERGLEILKEGQ